VGQLGHPRDVDERTDRVRGPRERDNARAVREQRLEVLEIQRRIVADLREEHAQVEVVGELEPGRDVGVVVELRDDDLLARGQLPPERAGEREVERRHVRPEDHFAVVAAQKLSARAPCFRDELIAAAARFERPAEVCIRLTQVSGDRVDDDVRNLRAARPVEERDPPVERGEPFPDASHPD
jgi:hypothetical protein